MIPAESARSLAEVRLRARASMGKTPPASPYRLVTMPIT